MWEGFVLLRWVSLDVELNCVDHAGLKLTEIHLSEIKGVQHHRDIFFYCRIWSHNVISVQCDN